MPKPYADHLKSSCSLVTTYEAVRAGFVKLALEKSRRATPFVAEARALKSAASKAESPKSLTRIDDIQAACLAAAGVSGKAKSHLDESDRTEAIDRLIESYLEPAGDNFVEELVFRFLLTKGDTLGGSMRNLGGYLAQCELTRSVVAHLRVAGAQYSWLPSQGQVWCAMPEHDADVELFARGLAWDTGEARTLIYNRKVPFVGNNVDLCLLRHKPEELSKVVLDDPSAYLALGELKSGIDPAGADEHWKTARTSLSRIREAFAQRESAPHIFFVGAAIAKNMAAEIWQMLECGMLSNAANLTVPEHAASITRWLLSL